MKPLSGEVLSSIVVLSTFSYRILSRTEANPVPGDLRAERCRRPAITASVLSPVATRVLNYHLIEACTATGGVMGAGYFRREKRLRKRNSIPWLYRYCSPEGKAPQRTAACISRRGSENSRAAQRQDLCRRRTDGRIVTQERTTVAESNSDPG